MLQQLQSIQITAALTMLNIELNNAENNRDAAAKDFCKNHLHDELHFKKANDVWCSKTDFINDMDNPNPFARQIGDFEFYQSAEDEFIVWCIVTTNTPPKEEQLPVIHRYRNLRIFKFAEGKFLLRIWYNYEMMPQAK